MSPRRSTRARTSSHGAEQRGHDEGVSPEHDIEAIDGRDRVHDHEENGNEEDEDDGAIYEQEEVTRCVCGNDELQINPNNPEFDDIDTGFFIQCEECHVWQHGYCVGIKDEADAPDKYWCEQCRPEYHTMIYKGSKEKRSLYTPVTDKRVKKKIGNNAGTKKNNPPVVKQEEKLEVTQADQIGGVVDNNINNGNNNIGSRRRTARDHKQHSEDEHGGHRRERSRGTLNSRDAEYEIMLKKALEESARESGVQPEEPELSSSELSRERRYRRRGTTSNNSTNSEKDDQEGSNSHDDDEKILLKTKMEENDVSNNNLKALSAGTVGSSAVISSGRSKRRRNHDSSDPQSDAEGFNHGVTSTTANTSIPTSNDLGEDDRKVLSSHNEMSATETDTNNATSTPRIVTTGVRPKRAKRNTSDNNGNVGNNNEESKSSSRNNNNSNKNNSNNKKKTKQEIDAEKPTKPRLPPQRISLLEMKRRVSGILEFVVRTQSDLTYEYHSGVDITKFIDEKPPAGALEDADAEQGEILDREAIRKDLTDNFNANISLIEGLTRKLIDWNTKYGEKI
ncbi:hypothetical protein PACTADRAFT_49055 [Pachysolen tannophilus NRRL Y-2460]|uniref:Zinc finger PHD-type domain-containing protein n=1 Tax=Pachysolen tannophilus NRRL Y-2460 TaxID=669874 RepID=A0A1E4TZX6_PACTA|nr:hypothetical protein PACTADRAFT_49055 [Pachysolen tannophilus NRRL Y-2460]